MAKDRVIIMGAAGRDFHNFNVYFRGNEAYEVMAFTATQIPNIEGRIYPPELAGPGYPDGIPIYPESKLAELIEELDIDQVVFGYSDVSHEYVMHRASMVPGRWSRFPADGLERDDAKGQGARDLSMCGTHRIGQEPDQPPRVRHPAGDG
jgi:predicted GTPase